MSTQFHSVLAMHCLACREPFVFDRGTYWYSKTVLAHSIGVEPKTLSNRGFRWTELEEHPIGGLYRYSDFVEELRGPAPQAKAS